jgi:DNA-directed RNA polymerase specialized sigma24 family protein
LLVHCFGWTLTEVAELLELSKNSVQTHVERGLERLRNDLGADRDG